MKEIIQLQETAERLINLSQPLDEVFILCEKIGKHEKSICKDCWREKISF